MKFRPMNTLEDIGFATFVDEKRRALYGHFSPDEEGSRWWLDVQCDVVPKCRSCMTDTEQWKNATPEERTKFRFKTAASEKEKKKGKEKKFEWQCSKHCFQWDYHHDRRVAKWPPAK